MQLLGATVKTQPRQVTTKYGDRRVCDVILQDGTESAIWGPVGYAALEYLERGQQVTVSRDSKGKVHIVENHLTHPEMTAPPLPNQSSAPQGMTPETKRQIAQYIQDQAKLFGYCLNQAGTIESLPADQRREVATTLFIQASRKFDLA